MEDIEIQKRLRRAGRFKKIKYWGDNISETISKNRNYKAIRNRRITGICI